MSQLVEIIISTKLKYETGSSLLPGRAPSSTEPLAQAAVAGLCPVFQLETSCDPPLSDSHPPGESRELSVFPPHVRPDGDKMRVIFLEQYPMAQLPAHNLCSCLSSPRYSPPGESNAFPRNPNLESRI